MRKPGSGRLTREIKAIVEQQMRLDDETTVYQLHRLFSIEGMPDFHQQTKCARFIVITVEDHSYI